MSRTGKYKLAWLGGLALAAGGVIVVLYLDLPAVWLLATAVLLLVPGRVGGFFLRDLFLSRRLMAAEKHEVALAASERMLQALDRQPSRQWFMYCFFNIYTWSARAMALNNLGVAELELGRLDDAEVHLTRAIEIDRAYPIPYYNLGVAAAVRGNTERSADMRSTAQELGYGNDAFDKTINRVSAAYARVQSLPG